MASRPGISLFLFLLSSLLFFPPASAQNIQTSFPSFPSFPSLPSPAFRNPLPQPPPPSPAPAAPPQPASDAKVWKAVAITASSSVGICALLFVGFLFFSARRREVKLQGGGKSAAVERLPESMPKLRPAASVIVDENGLDAIYWREFPQKRCQFCNHVLDPSGQIGADDEAGEDDEESPSPPIEGRRIQERPLLPLGSISSSSRSFASDHPPLPRPPSRLKSSSSSSLPSPPPPETSPPPPPPAPPPPTKSNSAAPPPPLPGPAPRPSPPSPPPPGGARPLSGSLARPPPVPPQSSAAVGADNGQKKLKPLHWDKVNAVNAQHSMVWDKITDGSFKFDEDIMEVLFGTMAANKKSNTSAASASAGTIAPATPTKITLLDSRKSQNIAIVIRSLTLSRRDILDALTEGRGLPVDVLERLTKIAPTKEEEALVRDYTGNPSKLADAESFLFHILLAVPSPFQRFEAMLFRANFEHEVADLKQSLQTLESACKELRSRGLFLKLLEAVLKAGNLMNAGTARGNAQAFNLTALCKLSDVKSTDGSTTLLHFVVEEVIRSEGKRLVVNRVSGLTLDRTASRIGSREEREKEYIKLGLPIVGGLSDEFASARKAAGVDYDAIAGTCASLGARLAEIKSFLSTCGGDGFAKELGAFMARAEQELRIVKVEQARVLELLRSTREYFQPGASKDKNAHPLQLFVIVRDFLNMVDKACVDIARNLQRKKSAPEAAAASASASGSDRGSQSGKKPMARFPCLPPNFLSEHSKSESSSDEEDGA